MIDQTISRVRRNHGLEHATIHVLSEKYRGFSAQGNSDHRGFSLNVYGNIKEDQVKGAVVEAYQRMKDGEHELAVHPNCGTALLTTATLAALAAQTVFGLEYRRQGEKGNLASVLFNALPSAILMVVLSIIVSRPLGLQLQSRFTTEGDLGTLEITDISAVSPSFATRIFHFLLAGGKAKYQPRAYRIKTKG
ncbi:MAG: DUF6391 domain-containing protein [Candidatus Promineifilaceae bacterium]|nr:DUF6391 domain-containing protein [Candidatus Promineifilaceae bacterium]